MADEPEDLDTEDEGLISFEEERVSQGLGSGPRAGQGAGLGLGVGAGLGAGRGPGSGGGRGGRGLGPHCSEPAPGQLILWSSVGLGGPGAVRGDRPRRPPSTLETEGVLEPGRTEVGGAEPGNSSHSHWPGRGRPPGSPARTERELGADRGRRASERDGLGRGRTHTAQPACCCPPGPALLQHGHSLLTAGAGSRLRSGNRSQAVAEVPHVPPSLPHAHLPGPGMGGPGPRASSSSSPAPSATAPPSPRCAKGWPSPGLRTPSPCSALKPCGLAGPWPLPLPSSAHHSQGQGVPRAARTARTLLAGPGLPMG